MFRPTRMLLVRFGRFNTVGLVNFTFKLAALAGLREWAGAGYLLATAVSVEAAILNSFLWHQIWTWQDRREGLTRGGLLARLLRYNVLNGTLAMATNLAVMLILVGSLGLHYLLAGVVATATAGLINFVVSDTLIFVLARKQPV